MVSCNVSHGERGANCDCIALSNVELQLLSVIAIEKRLLLFEGVQVMSELKFTRPRIFSSVKKCSFLFRHYWPIMMTCILLFYSIMLLLFI